MGFENGTKTKNEEILKSQFNRLDDMFEKLISKLINPLISKYKKTDPEYIEFLALQTDHIEITEEVYKSNLTFAKAIPKLQRLVDKMKLLAEKEGIPASELIDDEMVPPTN